MDVYALILSSISILISGLVAYYAYFRPANIEILVGKVISLYPLPEISGEEILWGGVAIQIPITFHNWSAKGGAVEEVRVILEHTDSPNTNYDMTWSRFTKIHQDDYRWANKSVAQPIAVPAKASVNEVILFAWKKSAGQPLKIETGKYEIKILTWLAGDKKPSLNFTSSFIVSNEIESQFASYMDSKMAMTIDIALGESSRLNTVISRDQVNSLYNI